MKWISFILLLSLIVCVTNQNTSAIPDGSFVIIPEMLGL